jgi:hypothetical protein
MDVLKSPMTNDIIEAIIFLIPGFLFFEIFYPLSGFDVKLSDKKYYFICLSISLIIYTLDGWISGILYVQELDSHLLKIKTVIYIYVTCIAVSFFLAWLFRKIFFPNYWVRLREPWSVFLEEINKNEASYVTVITSDSSEIEGKIRMFANKSNESREIIIEDPVQIIRNSETKVQTSKMKLGEEILFTKDDIRRIIHHKSTRSDPNWLEKFLHIKR